MGRHVRKGDIVAVISGKYKGRQGKILEILTEKERVRVEKSIDEPIVLFLGRVTFQKGPDYFLEAASRVVRVRPEVKFVIAGSGDMLSSMIERTCRAHGLTAAPGRWTCAQRLLSRIASASSA